MKKLLRTDARKNLPLPILSLREDDRREKVEDALMWRGCKAMVRRFVCIRYIREILQDPRCC